MTSVYTGGIGTYDEIVIFQEDHILPYAIVSLQATLPGTMPITPSTSEPNPLVAWSCEEVVEWISNLKLSKVYLFVVWTNL
jgi:hypothetical protein